MKLKAFIKELKGIFDLYGDIPILLSVETMDDEDEEMLVHGDAVGMAVEQDHESEKMFVRITALDAVRREELRKLVEVKPLEWKQNWPNDPLSAFAKPINRAYTIEHDSPRFYVTSRLWAEGEIEVGVANCSSFEEAKAAAQADYESSILAALLPKASVREERG